MPQFHETGYGKRFFDHQMPALISNLGRIATALEKLAANSSRSSEQDEELDRVLDGALNELSKMTKEDVKPK